MENSKYFQMLTKKGVDEKHQNAVSVYFTLAELSKQIQTIEDQKAWDDLWHEFMETPNWSRASWVIGRFGI